jgi:salicylate hydroxylase
LADITKSSHVEDRIQALRLYEKCRVERTYRIVDRGTLQMDLNHLSDGPEQMARDEKMRAFAEIEKRHLEGKNIEWTDLQKGDDPLVWRRYGAGEWLLSYDPQADIEQHRHPKLKGA